MLPKCDIAYYCRKYFWLYIYGVITYEEFCIRMKSFEFKQLGLWD